MPAAGSVLLLPAAGEPVFTPSSQKPAVIDGRDADHHPFDAIVEDVTQQQVAPGIGEEPGAVLASGDARELDPTGVRLDQTLLAVGFHGVVADDDSNLGGELAVLLQDDLVRRKGERVRRAVGDEVHVENPPVFGVGESDECEVRLGEIPVEGECRVRFVGLETRRPGDVGPADAGCLVVVCRQHGDAVDRQHADDASAYDSTDGMPAIVLERLEQRHACGGQCAVEHDGKNPGVHCISLCEMEANGADSIMIITNSQTSVIMKSL